VELSWPTDLCFCSVCSSNADSESGFFLGATVPLQCLWRDSVTLISTLLLTGHGMVQQLYGMLGCKSPVCNIYVALPFDDCYHPIVLMDLMYQKDWSGFCIMLCTGSRTGSVHIPYTTYSLWGPCFLFSCVVFYSVSQKNVPSLTGYSFNTHPPIFTVFGTCYQQRFKNWLQYNFLKYLTFTYFIMLWSEMTEMTSFPCRCVNMVFRANNKVLIKVCTNVTTELLQTFY